MTEILSPFKSKQKLLQTGLCALIFIAMAIPFKVMVLIEGFTEVRPVNAVPVVAGLLFGPAGAWGCAVGNVIADLFGTFSTASILGFFGNFIAAYLPYKLWHSFRKETPNVKSLKNIVMYLFISVSAAFATAILLGCGLDVFLGMWIPQVFWIIALNDLGFPILLGLPVFIILTSDDNRMKITMPEQSKTEGKRIPDVIKKILFFTFLSSELAIVLMVSFGTQMSANPVLSLTGVLFILSLSGFISAD